MPARDREPPDRSPPAPPDPGATVATTFTGGDAAARRYDAWFASPWGRYAWGVESAAVLDALGTVTGRRVVDVGCGTGRLLTQLAAAGAVVLGVDTDPAMLSVAATRSRGRLVLADARRLPLADASVQAAVAVATLEFTADPARALAEMARVVRPGGRLVAAVLNPASLWGWAGRVRHRDPYRQGCFLPHTELLRLGRRHGHAGVRGVLFAAEHLPARSLVGPVLEAAGRAAPRLGAFQVLTVDVAAPA
jgi:SAM-dependent methyltransferase